MGNLLLDSARLVINKRFLAYNLVDDGNSFHIVGTAFQRGGEDWEIGYWRSEDGNSWVTKWITNDTGANVFFTTTLHWLKMIAVISI